MSRIGDTIRAAREKRGWSPAKLAKESGVSPAQISRLENNERFDPHVSTLRKIGSSLNLGLDALYGSKIVEPATTPPDLEDRLEELEGQAKDSVLFGRQISGVSTALDVLLTAEELPQSLRDRLRDALAR